MESEAAAALAAAVVVEAAAATVETAALVGEAAAAAAEEEEGEAAAAKGKRTAQPGLGGIRSPGSLLGSPHPPSPGRGSVDLQGHCGASAPSSHCSSLRLLPSPSGEAKREAPQVLQTGWGWGALGRARAPGSLCVGGGGDSLESGAGDSPGWGRVSGGGEGPRLPRCPRPAPGACMRWGRRKENSFLGSRGPDKDDLEARYCGERPREFSGGLGREGRSLSNAGFL